MNRKRIKLNSYLERQIQSMNVVYYDCRKILCRAHDNHSIVDMCKICSLQPEEVIDHREKYRVLPVCQQVGIQLWFHI
jgi:hypothetical protein